MNAGIRLTSRPRDAHWWLTALAFIAVGIAAAMAIFGLPPVNLHGPAHRVGIMDPFCGGTRSARLTAQGKLAEAWRYNPLGILSVVAAVVVVVRAAVGITTGRWVDIAVSWTTRQTRATQVCLVLLLAALEIRQQLRADLLMAGT